MAIDFYKLISPSLKKVIEKRKKSEIELYAEYIANPKNKIKLPSDIQQNLDSQKIYNAFIMPAFVNESQNIGFVSADYALPQDSKFCEKPYHKIYGILLDIRTLMHSHRPHNIQAIAELAQKIAH